MTCIFNSCVAHIPARDFLDFPTLRDFSDKEMMAFVKLLCKTRGIKIKRHKTDYGYHYEVDTALFERGRWYRYEKAEGHWLFTEEWGDGGYLTHRYGD